MDARPITPIAYAPPLPRHRRLLKQWGRRIAVVAVCISAVWWGPPAWYRINVAYFERQCARHQASPETIVYTEFPGDVKTLAAKSGSYQPGPNDPPSLFLVPHAWSRFYSLLSPPGFQAYGTVFLHERASPRGEPLLVSVDYLGSLDHESGEFGLHEGLFQIRAFERGGPFSLPFELHSELQHVLLYTSRGGRGPVRLRAGQPDETDTSHFTIAWEIPGDGGVSGVIDGWVREGGVALEPRVTPELPRAPE